MKCTLCVCLAATICVGAALHSAVRHSVEQAQTRAMQKGIRVEMASATNAQAWPQADDNDAWVVAVTFNGELYLGAESMTPNQLKQWMIEHPRRRDQKLYIKADARASYANVEKALDAASNAEFATPVLLVNQWDATVKPGIVVPPKGLEVVIDGAQESAETIVVEVPSAKEPATLTINHEPVSWNSLQDRLRESVAGRNERTVVVAADGQASFAQVARVIDACGAVKARAVLRVATL